MLSEVVVPFVGPVVVAESVIAPALVQAGTVPIVPPIKKPLIISTLAVVELVAIITGLEILPIVVGSTDTAEPATVSDRK